MQYLIVGPTKRDGLYFVTRTRVRKGLTRGVGRTITKQRYEDAVRTAQGMRRRDGSKGPIRFIDASIPVLVSVK